MCKFPVVAVVLRCDVFVCGFYFILVDWASANLLFGEPHLERELEDNVRRRGQKFRRDK